MGKQARRVRRQAEVARAAHPGEAADAELASAMWDRCWSQWLETVHAMTQQVRVDAGEAKRVAAVRTTVGQFHAHRRDARARGADWPTYGYLPAVIAGPPIVQGCRWPSERP